MDPVERRVGLVAATEPSGSCLAGPPGQEVLTALTQPATVGWRAAQALALGLELRLQTLLLSEKRGRRCLRMAALDRGGKFLHSFHWAGRGSNAVFMVNASWGQHPRALVTEVWTVSDPHVPTKLNGPPGHFQVSGPMLGAQPQGGRRFPPHATTQPSCPEHPEMCSGRRRSVSRGASGQAESSAVLWEERWRTRWWEGPSGSTPSRLPADLFPWKLCPQASESA